MAKFSSTSLTIKGPGIDLLAISGATAGTTADLIATIIAGNWAPGLNIFREEWWIVGSAPFPLPRTCSSSK